MLKMIKNCKAYQCIMLRFWDAQVLNAHMASKSSCQQTGQLIYNLLTGPWYKQNHMGKKEPCTHLSAFECHFCVFPPPPLALNAVMWLGTPRCRVTLSVTSMCSLRPHEHDYSIPASAERHSARLLLS